MTSMEDGAPDVISTFDGRRIVIGEFLDASEPLGETFDLGSYATELTVADICRSIEESRTKGALTPADEVFDRIKRHLSVRDEVRRPC